MNTKRALDRNWRLHVRQVMRAFMVPAAASALVLGVAAPAHALDAAGPMGISAPSGFSSSGLIGGSTGQAKITTNKDTFIPAYASDLDQNEARIAQTMPSDGTISH